MTAATLAQSAVKIRLAGGEQPLILLPVSVNDTAAREFILDTGAGTTILTPEFARELGVRVTSTKEGQTAGGKVRVELGRVESIAVGQQWRSDVDVAITDLSHLGQAVGARVHGDLGYNFLKDFRLSLDFVRGKLRLDEPRHVDYVGPPALTEIPFRLAHPAKPLILADAHVNGAGPFRFAIDTGTSTTAISAELARKLKLNIATNSPITTGGKAIAASATRLLSLRLGTVEQRQVNVIVGNFLAMLSTAIKTKLDGIIGYNFFRHYKVVIDYPGAMLSLFYA